MNFNSNLVTVVGLILLPRISLNSTKLIQQIKFRNNVWIVGMRRRRFQIFLRRQDEIKVSSVCSEDWREIRDGAFYLNHQLGKKDHLRDFGFWRKR